MQHLSELLRIYEAELMQKVRQVVREELARSAPPAPEASPWMTRTEAARALRMTVSNLDRICKAGGLRKHRDGQGRPRFRRDEVEGYFTKTK